MRRQWGFEEILSLSWRVSSGSCSRYVWMVWSVLVTCTGFRLLWRRRRKWWMRLASLVRILLWWYKTFGHRSPWMHLQVPSAFLVITRAFLPFHFPKSKCSLFQWSPSLPDTFGLFAQRAEQPGTGHWKYVSSSLYLGWIGMAGGYLLSGVQKGF